MIEAFKIVWKVLAPVVVAFLSIVFFEVGFVEAVFMLVTTWLGVS